MNCHYSCSPTTTMTTTTTTPYDPIAVCEGTCDDNCDKIENHFERNQCLLTCYNHCSTTTTRALTLTTTRPATTTTHPFALCHNNCEIHCAKYQNHDDELNCLTNCITNCIPSTTATTTPSASEVCYRDCNGDCPEYDSICLVACYQGCLVLIPTTAPAYVRTTTTTTTTTSTTTTTTTTSTSTTTTTTTTTSTTTESATEKTQSMGWLELLGLAVLAAVMTVFAVVITFRGENIYRWCRRGCRPKKSKSRGRKIRPASPESSEHQLLDENRELNKIKAQNRRISEAINKINDLENERLREQLRRVERATAVEQPLYAPEYSRAYDQTASRRLMEPRTNSFYRRSRTEFPEEPYREEPYRESVREPVRATRFDQTADRVQRRVRPKPDEESNSRYQNESSRQVKSNLLTDQRRQYSKKKSSADLIQTTETKDDHEIDEPLERKPRKQKQFDSDLSDY